MSDAHISSQTTLRTPRTICVKRGKVILTLFVHAMQDAAELILNRCTKHTCQGGEEILTLFLFISIFIFIIIVFVTLNIITFIMIFIVNIVLDVVCTCNAGCS